MSLTKMTEEKMQARAKESSWASDKKETNAQGPQKKEAIWKGDRSLNKCRWGRPHILVEGMSILIRLKSFKQIQRDIQPKLRNSIKKLHNITP